MGRRKKEKKHDYGEEGNLNLKMVIALKRSINAVTKNAAPYFHESGITETQFGILEVLYHKGPMPICEIIRKTLSTGGNMTVVIDNLVKLKLVERNPDPEDRRSYIISLTGSGESLIKKVFPAHLENLNQFFKTLSKKEKETFIEISRKLKEN